MVEHNTFRLDHRQLDRWLKRERGVVRKITELTEKIAANVQRELPLGLSVDTHIEESADRITGLVIIPHKGGVQLQAQHGLFTRATSEVGLELREVTSQARWLSRQHSPRSVHLLRFGQQK